MVTPVSEGSGLELTLDFGGAKRVVACKLGDDYVLRPNGVIGGEVESEVVFAGYGRDDDYGALAVNNRFVLVFEGAPDDPAGA